MSEFKVVVPVDVAEAEVNALLDRKKTLPNRKENLKVMIDAVAEGISLGYVTIEGDTITQTLIDPVGELKELVYNTRITGEQKNKAMGSIKSDTIQARIMILIKLMTGQLEATINKLESGDKNIADSIALFFI